VEVVNMISGLGKNMIFGSRKKRLWGWEVRSKNMGRIWGGRIWTISPSN